MAVLNQLLIRSGREEQAMMTTLAGLIVVLTLLVGNRQSIQYGQIGIWIITDRKEKQRKERNGWRLRPLPG